MSVRSRKLTVAFGVLVMVSALCFAAGAGAKGKGVLAARIGAGPISLSCAVKGRADDRVRLAIGVGYADVRPALERRLAGRKGGGLLKVTLLTRRGKVLARATDREPVGIGGTDNRVHHTHQLLLNRKVSERVLSYAQGKGRCSARPRHNRLVRLRIDARQKFVAPAAVPGAQVSTRRARLKGSGRVIGLTGTQATGCAPYPCYEKAAQVLAWTPSEARPVDMASVPVAARPPVSGPQMLVGLDNGPWAYWTDSDLNSQGSARTGNVYNFSRWQYVDSLYYYSHNLLSVPPTVWTNAAHRNGVTVLGSVTGDCDECGEELNELFKNHGPQAVQQLYKLAVAYGFDGWMIDVEAGAEYTPELLAAMRSLRSMTLPGGRSVQVLTYEAFQPKLNEGLLEPFLAAGEWQADYDHAAASGYPKETYEFLAGKSLTNLRYKTYWATDVYRPYDRGPNACGRQSSANFIWNGFSCSEVSSLFANLGSARAPQNPPGFYQSMALYAPGWTMFGGRREASEAPPPRAVFQAADERFWSGVGGYQLSGGACNVTFSGQNAVSSLLAPRPSLTSVPFSTRFDTGEGDSFAVEGKVAGRDWNLLSAQDLQPTGFCSDTRELGASINYANAYDGGSSLVVSGRATPGFRRLYPFEANAQLPARPGFVLRYLSSGQGPEPQVSAWINGLGPYELPVVSRKVSGPWVTALSVLPEGVPAGVLTRIGIGFPAIGPVDVRATIGELAVVDQTRYTPPAEISPTFASGQLTWTDPAQPGTTQYYNVWAQARGSSCSSFIGRAVLGRYDLSRPLFAVPREVQRFAVQPVNTSGLASPVSPLPC